MKSLFRAVLFSLVALAIAQCTSRDASVKEINRNLDSIDVIFTKPGLDSARIFVLARSVRDFVKKYPTDSCSPKYLLKMGLTYQKAGMYLQAVSDFQQLQKQFPSDSNCSKALFYEAFLYANTINRQDSAKILYQLYLSRYASRDSSTRRIVETELNTLGKSPEEILNDLKKDPVKKNNG